MHHASHLWWLLCPLVCQLCHFPWLQHVRNSTSTGVFKDRCQTLTHACQSWHPIPLFFFFNCVQYVQWCLLDKVMKLRGVSFKNQALTLWTCTWKRGWFWWAHAFFLCCCCLVIIILLINLLSWFQCVRLAVCQSGQSGCSNFGNNYSADSGQLFADTRGWEGRAANHYVLVVFTMPEGTALCC